jgi:glycosyltransferase involved in cell wall biosynthesis
LKGRELFERAVRHAQRVIPDLRSVILDGNVHPNDMPIYLNASDCVVLASVSEGSPNIVKEALACNVPVVAVDVGDVRHRLAGVRSCRIVSRSAQALARGITEIIAAGERSDGRTHVSCCSLEKTTELWMELYRSFASEFHVDDTVIAAAASAAK